MRAGHALQQATGSLTRSRTTVLGREAWSLYSSVRVTFWWDGSTITASAPAASGTFAAARSTARTNSRSRSRSRRRLEPSTRWCARLRPFLLFRLAGHLHKQARSPAPDEVRRGVSSRKSEDEQGTSDLPEGTVDAAIYARVSHKRRSRARVLPAGEGGLAAAATWRSFHTGSSSCARWRCLPAAGRTGRSTTLDVSADVSTRWSSALAKRYAKSWFGVKEPGEATWRKLPGVARAGGLGS